MKRRIVSSCRFRRFVVILADAMLANENDNRAGPTDRIFEGRHPPKARAQLATVRER
jgi:hypothetical protein